MVISKQHIRNKFGKAVTSYNQAAQAQQVIVKELFDMIPYHILTITQGNVLEIGCGSGLLTQLIGQKFPTVQFTINDLTKAWQADIDHILKGKQYQFIEADAELFPFTDTYDLIITSSAIQWFHEPQHFISKAYHALKPNGVLLISTFSTDNLHQIKNITGKGLNYPTPTALCQTLPCEAQTEWHQHYIELFFATPHHVLKHIQDTGTGATNNSQWTRSDYTAFTVKYEQFHTHKGYPLTYHPLYIKIIKPQLNR